MPPIYLNEFHKLLKLFSNSHRVGFSWCKGTKIFFVKKSASHGLVWPILKKVASFT